jgi:hypothetical protein
MLRKLTEVSEGLNVHIFETSYRDNGLHFKLLLPHIDTVMILLYKEETRGRDVVLFLSH